MAKISKRMRNIQTQITPNHLYAANEALQLLKKLASAKFVESVEASVILGVDPRKSDQVVRGATQLPHGSGRDVRVAVFAQGAAAQAAKDAGADIVGFEDLAEEIKRKAQANEKFGIDVIVASPDAMRIIGQIGRILGPRGLMPNPKVGTVTPDVAGAVKKAKSGQVTYRTDKGGIIHCTIGKVDFEPQALQENLEKLIADLKRIKPSTAKGIYLKRIALSTTMGPGLLVDQTTLLA
jgi:large subunit ribosomal protein L1